jgi:plastocyanin
MKRSLVSVATLSLGALALVGCPEDPKPDPSKTSGATKPPATTAPPATTGSAGPTKPAGGGGEDKFGKGVIKGVVTFAGAAPEMKVPKKRKDAEFCKDTEVKYNAVLVKDGKLKDVYVGVASGQLKGSYEATKPATVDQKACMYEPRMQGQVAEGELLVKNSDPASHNVNTWLGASSLFNQAQTKGAADIKKTLSEPGVYRLQCDMHSWMRAFVVVSDNPFHAVSGDDGAFNIEKVPDGKHKVMAWHSQYGKKEQEVEVKGGATVEVKFEFSDKDAEPAENKGELNDLF